MQQAIEQGFVVVQPGLVIGLCRGNSLDFFLEGLISMWVSSVLTPPIDLGGRGIETELSQSMLDQNPRILSGSVCK